MNSRQRRGVILLLLSVVCALAAFAGVLAVIGNVNSEVGPKTTAYELKQDIAPYTALRDDQFTRIAMPKKWLSPTAVTDLSAIRGKIAVTTLRKGSLLQQDMIVQRPELAPGQEEIAIMIDAETGVAGKITPGSLVNIFATYGGDKNGGDTGSRNESRIIVSDARVLDVGKLTSLSKDSPTNGTLGGGTQEAVPITFALDAEDAQRVAYAESFAEHVRLALLPGGKPVTVPPSQRSYTLEGDK
jgi:pilus assembly protein CpaB